MKTSNIKKAKKNKIQKGLKENKSAMLIKRRQSKDILSLATIYWQQLSKYLMSRAMTFIQSEIDEILSFHCISSQDFSRRRFSTSLCPCLFVQWCRRENRGAGLIKIKRQETLYNVNSVYYILLWLYGENLYYIAKTFLFSFDTVVTPWFYYRIMIIYLLLLLFMFTFFFLSFVLCLVCVFPLLLVSWLMKLPQPLISLSLSPFCSFFIPQPTAQLKRIKEAGPAHCCHQTAG